MKKKFFISLICLMAFVGSSRAEWYVGGGVQAWYAFGAYEFSIMPNVGYEFNDKIAVGGELYGGIYNNVVGLGLKPYVRYTFWSSEYVALQIKGSVMGGVYTGFYTAHVGVSPGVRLTLSEHCQIEGNFGFFGAQYDGSVLNPLRLGLSMDASDVSLSVLFPL